MLYIGKASEVADVFSKDSRLCGVFQYLKSNRVLFVYYFSHICKSIVVRYKVPQKPSLKALVKYIVTQISVSKNAKKIVSDDKMLSSMSWREIGYFLSDSLGFRDVLVVDLETVDVCLSKDLICFINDLLSISLHTDFRWCIVSSMKELLPPLNLISPEDYRSSMFPDAASKSVHNTTQIPDLRISGSIKVLDEKLLTLDEFSPDANVIQVGGQESLRTILNDSDIVNVLICRLESKSNLRWVLVNIENTSNPFFSKTVYPGTTMSIRSKVDQRILFFLKFDCSVDDPRDILNPHPWGGN